MELRGNGKEKGSENRKLIPFFLYYPIVAVISKGLFCTGEWLFDNR